MLLSAVTMSGIGAALCLFDAVAVTPSGAGAGRVLWGAGWCMLLLLLCCRLLQRHLANF
jgi:hypothetical protein